MQNKSLKKYKRWTQALFIMGIAIFGILQGYSIYRLITDNQDNLQQIKPEIKFDLINSSISLIIPIYIQNNGFFEIGESSFYLRIENQTSFKEIIVKIPKIPSNSILNITLTTIISKNISEVFDWKELITSMLNANFEIHLNLILIPIEILGNGTKIDVVGL